MLDALRAQQILDGRLRIDHLPGPVEPLLWVPDAIAGAVVAARTSETSYLTTLGDQVTVIEISSR